MEKGKIVIMLDAGHGVNTQGNCSPDGKIKEWKYTREILSILKDRLTNDGYSCFIVHNEDMEIKSQSYDLKLRTDRANKEYSKLKKEGKTAIFISIHLNATGNGKEWLNASGWTVWVSKNASNKSKQLATLMYDEACNAGLKGNRCVQPNKYCTYDFWVLRKTQMPAVLTENMFMTNKNDTELLLSDEGKEKIVAVHLEAIKKYVEAI